MTHALPPSDRSEQTGDGGISTPTYTYVLSSRDLLQGRREVLIEHGCETYRLRLARSGKLILQK